MEIKQCFYVPGDVPGQPHLAVHLQTGKNEEILVFRSHRQVAEYLNSITVENKEEIPKIVALAEKYLPVLNEKEIAHFVGEQLDFVLLLLDNGMRLAEQVEALMSGNSRQIRKATFDDFFPVS